MFFGYECEHGSYHLTESTKKAIREFPFPIDTKKAQSFLGSANFFQSFVPNYSLVVGDLHDMTTKKFN